MHGELKLVGRDALVRDLVAHVREGHAVVIYGPGGIGASAVLDAVARRVANERSIIRVERLEHVADLTAALARVYLDHAAASARATRALAIEQARRRPSALLVDRVVRASAPTRNDIRVLGAVGVGAIIAGAVEQQRDHDRLRAMRLAHREIEIPVLERAQLRAIFEHRLSMVMLARVVTDDRERLLAAASGRPGLLAKMADRLDDSRYWSAGRVLVEPLRADVTAGLESAGSWMR